MAVNANGAWIGFGVGDTDPVNAKRTDPNWDAVTLINQKLYDRFTSTHALGQTRDKSVYDEITAKSVALIAKNYGMTVPADVQGNAVANLAFRRKIGAYPPPPPPTHAMFTVRGTGGIVGLDFTSRIAQASPCHHEHVIDYAASMGGIPVGAATDPNAPSGNECADDVFQRLTDAVLGSTVTFSIAAYSLGTKGVVMFLNALCDPTHPLYEHRDRLVCVVMVADPWRPFGKSFYMGPVQDGQGIGAPYFTMSKAAQEFLGWRCCWLVNPADLYTNAPLGGTGLVLADVEEFILGTSVSDPLGLMARFVQMLLQLVVRDGGIISGGGTVVNQPGGSTSSAGGGLLGGLLGGGAGNILGGLLGGGASPASLITGVAGGSIGLTAGLVPLMLPLLLGGFEGLIDGISGNGVNLPKGPAADVQAAILALKFFGSGTAPHITYDSVPWGIGPQTFLDLGIQHANDWGSRTPVLV